MDLELLTIGDELLLGFTIDTNAAHLARQLAALGVRIVRRATVGDDADAIVDALRAALDRTGAVITTGGLGPTADDRSKEAVAALFGRRLVLDQEILARLEARWQRRFGTPLPESNRAQAMMPEGAVILENRHGSAPGVWLEDARGRWVAMLPGVPREMRGMLADVIIPRLAARVGDDPTVVATRTLRTTSIAESALADRLGPLARGVDGLPLAFLPGLEGVDLRLTCVGRPAGEATAALAAAADRIRALAGPWIYGEGDDDLAALVLERLAAAGATLAVAESCTGGLLGGRITGVPGASRVFPGGVIAYDNVVKVRELGVDADVLQAEGAVSEPVARQLAAGARRRFGATFGLGVTGIAGPGGGSEAKPVGTVWVAVDDAHGSDAWRVVLPGDRGEIRARAAQSALDLLRRRLPTTLGDTTTPPRG